MKSWLKGGISGAIIGFIIGIVIAILFSQVVAPCMPGMDCSINPISNLKMQFTIVLLLTIIYFIIGSLIGLIIQKIKSK